MDAKTLLLLLMSVAPQTLSPAAPCALRVAHERDPRSGDRVQSESLPFAPVKGHRNEAPGPDSLLLVSRTTRGFYPRVYLEDRRAGTSRCLEPRGWSELTSWSPNGRWYAYVHKDTVANLERLVVGSPRRPRAAVFERTVDIVDYRWSPDSRAVALYGRDRVTRAVALYIFWPETRAAWRVDQLQYFLDIDFDWAPDGRQVAYSRPEGANDSEEITSADIMLADVRSRSVCRLCRTPDRVESRPEWVSANALRCTIQAARGSAVGTPRDIIMELGTSSK